MTDVRPTAASKARQQANLQTRRTDSKGLHATPPMQKVPSSEGVSSRSATSRAQSPFARPTPKSSRSSGATTPNAEATSDTESTNNELHALRASLRQAEIARETCEQELMSTKGAVDTLQTNHVRLEERLMDKTKELERKEADMKELTSQLRVSEQNAEQDRAKLISEKSELSLKQEEMSDTIKRLHQRTNSMTTTPRSKDIDKSESTGSLHSRSNSSNTTLVLQMNLAAKERQIQAFEDQVRELHKVIKELTTSGSPQLKSMERRIEELVSENGRLREDNEGYQTLLQNKTMNGEFSSSQFMQSTSSTSRYQSMRGLPNGLDLASELDTASLTSTDGDCQDIEGAGRADLEAEVLKLQESNKALTLYVNTIVARMLNTQGFEHLLAKDVSDMQPLNAPPRPVNVEPSGQSFLQRTKSVLTRKPAPPETSGTPDQERLRPSAPREVNRRTSIDISAFNSSRGSIDDTMRRERSPAKGASRSPVGTPRASGLRPLASGAAADHITPKEARRLSAQFAPITVPAAGEWKEPTTAADAVTTDKKAKRASWMGWLGTKEKAPELTSTFSEDSRSIHRIEDLKPLQEIDQEIERAAGK